MKNPLSYSGTSARHSASSTKSPYCFSVRNQPVPVTRRRLPLVTTKVTSCTGTQPLRSLPLNSGSQPTSFAASAAKQGRVKAKQASRRAGNSFNTIVFISGNLKLGIYNLGQRDPLNAWISAQDAKACCGLPPEAGLPKSEEHTSELQS